MRDQRGLTLVELLVALVMLAVVFGGMFASTRAMGQSWAVGQHRVGVQQMARASLDWMIRRIRLAGQLLPDPNPSPDPTLPLQCLPLYVEAKQDTFRFRADVVPGPGRCGPLEELEYSVSGGKLMETVYGAGATGSQRVLTVTEEVGTITVTDLNFCYYDVFDQLLPGQTLSIAGGQETCSGRVESRLGDIYRVKVRLRVISGRSGEMPFDIVSQAVRRLEVLP